MRVWRYIALTTAVFIALVWLDSESHAHGALTLNRRLCLLKVGPDLMYFSAYQSAKKFCEDVPAAGETIFTMDFAQEEMRNMTTDFRIVRDLGEGDEQISLDAVTIAYLPPRIYPTGTVTLRHYFADAGDYVGIVRVEGTHGEHWTARFPFTVGWRLRPRAYYLLAAAVVADLLLCFWPK
jgi:hypothetical protein